MADSQKYDRTAQLLDKDNIVDGGAFYPSVTGDRMIASNNTAILLLPCKPNTTYTISRRNVITKRFVMCFLTSNEIYVDMPIYGDAHDDTGLTITSTSTAESQYLCFYYAKTGGSDSSTPEEIQSQLAEVMINEGPIAKPYQPYLEWQHSLRKLTTATEAVENPLYTDGTAITSYTISGNTVQSGTPTPQNPVDVVGVGTLDSGQYKIPISSASTTTPVYLGEVESTRRIKKLVFDGSDDEPWYKSGSYNGSFYCSRAIIGIIDATTTALCNRASFTPTINITDYTQGKFGFDGNYATGEKSLNFYYDDGTATLSDFKTWLSNNPIIVWYVLATPETAAVNEPLMKIGTYADTLSNAASIPTAEGANSISVDTTVQPSEFTATWTGWHDSSVKEWDGSQWG